MAIRLQTADGVIELIDKNEMTKLVKLCFKWIVLQQDHWLRKVLWGNVQAPSLFEVCANAHIL